MKKFIIAILVIAVIGGASYGGWVYAGKPDVVSMMLGENETSPKTATEETNAEILALTAKYETLLNENFVLESGAEVTADDVTALLPTSIKLSIASSEFDEATGATIWKDVSLTGAENTNIGLTAEEVKLWGLNTDGIAARVAGTNFAETVKLAERIEAKGVKSLGLEIMTADWMVAYVESVASTIGAVAPEDGISEEELEEMRAAMEMVIDDYQIDIAKLVAVGPQMRPWEIARIDPEVIDAEGDKAALLVLQEAAAYYRTFGVDHLIWTDTNFTMKMVQDGVSQEVEGTYDFVAYSGWYGGNVESSVIKGMRFGQDLDMAEAMEQDDLSAEDLPPGFENIRMDFEIGSGAFQGMELDKVLRYVAMGEWPPTTDVDLMSYGRFDMYDWTMKLNGNSFFSVSQTVFDFSDWHWFIPSQAELSFKGLTYDIDGIVDLIRPALQQEDPEGLEMAEKFLDIFNKYEALPIVFDGSYVWDWNPETGAFTFASPQKHHSFGEAQFELSGFLPNFEEGVAALREDMAFVPEPDAEYWEVQFRETAWEKLIAEKFSVTGGLLVLDDEGGLDKVFGMISELGKLNPDEFGPMMANQTPESLRTMAVSGIGFSAIQAGKDFPQAENWIMPFADWVRDGGTFTVRLDPTEPLGADLEEKYPDPSPDEISEILGLTVTHDAP